MIEFMARVVALIMMASALWLISLDKLAESTHCVAWAACIYAMLASMKEPAR